MDVFGVKVYALLMQEILPSAVNRDKIESSAQSDEQFKYNLKIRRISALGWSTSKEIARNEFCSAI